MYSHHCQFDVIMTSCACWDRPKIVRCNSNGGWSGGAMVPGKLPVPGRPTIWITVGQGPTALAVGAGGGCLDIFTLSYPFSPLSPSLWETARYRLKYCLKGPLNPKQPTKNVLQTVHSPFFNKKSGNTLFKFNVCPSRHMTS